MRNPAPTRITQSINAERSEMSADELMEVQINRLDELRKLRDVLADLGSGLSSSQHAYLGRRMLELTNSKPKGTAE